MRILKEWCDRGPRKKYRHFPYNLTEEYEDGDILHFWYLCNQDSLGVKKFIVGLNDLMNDCFPNEQKFAETQESALSSLIHRYILVRHGDER